ncbi:hypothetical protein T03_13030 [Trichinella britovi]|uniref:Uncharacterized protein n=1 Tax=Trichinella britovi TaxID=45882 RepID=A0A0V1DIH5_TRIBR|nr:hypothetical protein T03_13030 [Trichinella britovi]
MPSAARLLLYSYVQRNVNVQDNTTQYLERVWLATPSAARLLLYSYVQRNMYKMIQRNILKERGLTIALFMFLP